MAPRKKPPARKPAKLPKQSRSAMPRGSRKSAPEIALPLVRAARAARAGQTVQDAILAGMLDPVLIIDGYGTIERANR